MQGFTTKLPVYLSNSCKAHENGHEKTENTNQPVAFDFLFEYFKQFLTLLYFVETVFIFLDLAKKLLPVHNKTIKSLKSVAEKLGLSQNLFDLPPFQR